MNVLEYNLIEYPLFGKVEAANPTEAYVRLDCLKHLLFYRPCTPSGVRIRNYGNDLNDGILTKF